jgi:general secretion pathway protein A
MYESFYGLTGKPFQKTPDPRFLYRGTQHQEALDRLLYAVEERELVVLVGEVGSGKTLLTRALVDALPADKHEIAMLLNPRLTQSQLLATLAAEWGVPAPKRGKADLWRQLAARLMECHSKGILPVAIVDEAQFIARPEVFDELRLLTNYQLDDLNLCSLVIVGQPELKKRLATPRLRAFRQRIGMQYELRPLSAADTTAYVLHRLAVAGRTQPLFEHEALAAIHRHTGGLPRSINNLANMALLAAFTMDSPLVTAAIVEDVLYDVEGRWRAEA